MLQTNHCPTLVPAWFRERLRELRTERGLSQAALAAPSGIVDVRLSNFESGARVPTRAQLGPVMK